MKIIIPKQLQEGDLISIISPSSGLANLFPNRVKKGLQTYYGPCLISELGEYPDVLAYTKDSFLKILTQSFAGEIKPSLQWTEEFLDWSDEKNHYTSRKLTKNSGYIWWKKGFCTGDLLGGCIPSLNHLAGTEYWNDFTGKILFIDLPEGTQLGKGISLSSLDSFLADLQNLQVFKSISGIIFGRCYSQSLQNIKKIKNMILSYTEKYTYPILYNVDIGHTSPTTTLPMGAKIILDSINNKLTLIK